MESDGVGMEMEAIMESVADGIREAIMESDEIGTVREALDSHLRLIY